MAARIRRSQKEIIQDKITKLEEQITIFEQKISGLKSERADNIALLKEIEDAENRAREEAEKEELFALLKAKNVSLDEIRDFLNGK